MISFAGLRDRDGIKEREEGERGRGGGDYSREAIILILLYIQLTFSFLIGPKAYSELSVKKQKHQGSQ